MPARNTRRRSGGKLRIGAAVTLLILAAWALTSIVLMSPAPNGDNPDRPEPTAGRGQVDVQRAIARAGGSGEVVLPAGNYGELRLRGPLRRPLTIRAQPRAVVRMTGASISGVQNVRLQGLTFTGPVNISPGKDGQPTANIVLDGNRVSRPNANCVQIRAGVRDVTLRNNYIHDCRYGLIGPPSDSEKSFGVHVVGNLFERFGGDAISFANWQDSSVRGNVVRDMRDPKGVVHNDGIQLIGDVRDLDITDNRISGSSGQLIIMQAQSGPIDDVRVVGNVLADVDGIALHAFGVTRAVIAQNTIVSSKLTGLLIRPGRLGNSTDAVVENNLLDGFAVLPPARAGVVRRNLIVGAVGEVPSGNRAVARLHLVGERQGDYRPDPRHLQRAPMGPPGQDRDQLGRERPAYPAVGALEPPGIDANRKGASKSCAARATLPSALAASSALAKRAAGC